MAKVRTYVSLDMTDLSAQIGRVTYYDNRTLVISVGQNDTYYLGDFTYPGLSWKGTIEKIVTYEQGKETGWVTGLDLDTKFATAGTSRDAAYRRALAEDDVIIGSIEGDILVGYAGRDRMNGGGGDDELLGKVGDDELLGSGGADNLKGNDGKDRLQGGRGADRLSGGEGGDRFVFSDSDGVDQVTDFQK